jgi:hypothetical protein
VSDSSSDDDTSSSSSESESEAAKSDAESEEAIGYEEMREMITRAYAAVDEEDEDEEGGGKGGGRGMSMTDALVSFCRSGYRHDRAARAIEGAPCMITPLEVSTGASDPCHYKAGPEPLPVSCT